MDEKARFWARRTLHARALGLMLPGGFCYPEMAARYHATQAQYSVEFNTVADCRCKRVSYESFKKSPVGTKGTDRNEGPVAVRRPCPSSEPNTDHCRC